MPSCFQTVGWASGRAFGCGKSSVSAGFPQKTYGDPAEAVAKKSAMLHKRAERRVFISVF